MALVVAFDDAKINRVRFDGYGADGRAGYFHTQFIGSSSEPGTLLAYMSEHEPGRVTTPHYHVVDEYQIMLTTGKFGRHEVVPNTVHFARAYTPYGPLSGDGHEFSFLTLRTRCDPGSQRSKDKLKAVPNRQPWQITRVPAFPRFQPVEASADTILQPIPDIKDEKGLAAYSLSMKPNARVSSPDPSQGDGQYLVVLKGSLLHDHKEHKALTLALIKPNEGAYQMQAGPEGLEALVLNFPTVDVEAAVKTARKPQVTGSKAWQCMLCEFTYNEAAGRPDDGIPPGTRWEDVPESWTCPDCGASKNDFNVNT